MQKKVTAYILCATLILCYAAQLPHNTVTATLCHLNIFHLLLNVVTLWKLYTSTLNSYNSAIIIPACYIMATLAFALSPENAIGASAFILSLFTFILMRNLNKHNITLLIALIALSFLPGIATLVHLYSIALPVLAYFAYTVARFIYHNV